MSARAGVPFDKGLAQETAVYVGGHPNLVQIFGTLIFESTIACPKVNFEQIKQLWLSQDALWRAEILSLFKHQRSFSSETGGIDTDHRLRRSLELLGVLHANPDGSTSFAPYVRDLLSHSGSIADDQMAVTLERLTDKQPNPTEIERILERGLRSAFRDKPPSHEKEVQRMVEVSLSAVGFAFDRETPSFRYSLKNWRPDHVLKDHTLALETKLCRDQSDVARVVEEMSSDVHPYLQHFDKMLFLIFDLGGIHDLQSFKRDFEKNPRVRVLIIKR